MSLRRTALARKSELRRTPIERRTRERAVAARAAAAKVRKSSDPTPAQRALVAERAGYCCEMCGARLHDGESWIAVHSVHHRQPRGAGGTRRPEANAAYNLLLVCGSGTTGCHGFIESHRKTAEYEGWVVRHGLDPAEVPVSIHRQDTPLLLTADGDYQEVPT